MSLLSLLIDPECWEKFYEYKTSLICEKTFDKELRDFIDRKEYLSVCAAIYEGKPFPLPRKALISKQSSQKKRTVYIYPKAENIVLKLLTYLLLRKYNSLFTPDLYSFRPGLTAKDAVRHLLKTPGLSGMYSYKADVSNYFNSVPIPKLVPMLEKAFSDDPELFAFLRGLLEETRAVDGGVIVEEPKGIMAGTPIASFCANLYLDGLDRWFYERKIPYARYSDDIIILAPTREETERYAGKVRDTLAAMGLGINPDKEFFSSPEKGFTFLGFSVCGGKVDIAKASVDKLKGKMRRKTRALMRWRTRNGLEGERAAKAFTRIFNRKLLENSRDNDLTWSYWFFSVINTSESLHEIDLYAQDCLRYLISGTRTKARYNVRYDELKSLGYRSLVNAFYGHEGEEK